MIQLPILLATGVAEKASVSEALPYLMGFVVVLITLTFLWGICAATGMVLQKVTRSAAPVQPAHIPADAADDGMISQETLVVIAAAVTTAMGEPRRIVSVQPHNPAWSQAGRQQILSSHKVR